MFLYEKLYEIGKTVDHNNTQSIIDTLRNMLQECMNYVGKENDALGNNKTLTDIRTVFIKTDTQWRMACKNLENDGIVIANTEGFKQYVKSKEGFKEIFL